MVNAHITLPDGDKRPYVITTKDAVIHVNVTLGQQVNEFVAANWQWLWATFIFPVVGYRFTRRRRRRYDEDETYRVAA